MRSLVLTIAIVFASLTLGFAQQNLPLSKKQKERQEQEIEENKTKLIEKVLKDLGLDELQKELTRQSIVVYLEKTIKIYKSGLVYYKRDQLIQDLDATHFVDLQGVIPDDAIEKIKKRLKGKKDDSKEKKKNKRKDKAKQEQG